MERRAIRDLLRHLMEFSPDFAALHPGYGLRKSPTLRPARQSDRTPPDIWNGENRLMTSAPNISPLDQARILSEALPHMQQYDEETIVIKYGGHAMGAEETAKAFARDIVLLEQTAINPVVVHGGGPQIATMLKRLGIQSEFAAGLRITDAATIEIVEMVLAGSVNKQLVGYINEAGGKAVGLSGKDGNMVKASKTTRTMVDVIRISRRRSTSASSAIPTRSI